MMGITDAWQHNVQIEFFHRWGFSPSIGFFALICVETIYGSNDPASLYDNILSEDHFLTTADFTPGIKRTTSLSNTAVYKYYTIRYFSATGSSGLGSAYVGSNPYYIMSYLKFLGL